MDSSTVEYLSLLSIGNKFCFDVNLLSDWVPLHNENPQQLSQIFFEKIVEIPHYALLLLNGSLHFSTLTIEYRYKISLFFSPLPKYEYVILPLNGHASLRALKKNYYLSLQNYSVN